MIAEPYICIKGTKAGTIEWFDDSDGFICDATEPWERYADFERERLKKLNADCVLVMNGYSYSGFYVYCKAHGERCYYSNKVTGYSIDAYLADSESNRLIKRAEFLKAVCEKEGIKWLPTQKKGCCPCPLEGYELPADFLRCLCPCHETVEVKHESLYGEDIPCNCGAKGLHRCPMATPAIAEVNEREWRKALLDFLAASPLAGTYEQDQIYDLRKRFL